MTRDMEHHQDDKTVLLDHWGQTPEHNLLTDCAAPPRFEHLDQRMIYAAQRSPKQMFNISLNVLVAASSNLLSEVVQLKHRDTPEDLVALKQRLGNELGLFQERALRDGAEESLVTTARYVLCTVVDEAIVTTTWGSVSDWSQMSLLSTFHNETFGGEKVFLLLERLLKSPVRHLPMLELIYLCLSLGFEGKYRVQVRGTVELEDLRDGLYRQIRQLRADVPRELSPHWEGLSDPRRNLVRIVPAWMVVLFTVVCLLVMFSSFAWVLGEQRDTALKPYQPLGMTMVQPRSQA
ncbi:type IVB secretion system protein IcmH/DotU [Pseudomonas sp. MYb118]|uniref:type IVB secretion system protein IcmH/DotU n=1 Tax=Pseudomonas sp. MYb118 TaxID=1848720 RepID=UPI0034CDC596